MHTCRTSDGMSIGCFCIRGKDHNEAEFDVPAAPAHVEELLRTNYRISAEALAKQDPPVVLGEPRIIPGEAEDIAPLERWGWHAIGDDGKDYGIVTTYDPQAAAV